MVEKQSAELSMTKQSKGGRRAVDEMSPRRNERGVDTKALRSKGESTDLGGAVK